MLNQGVLMQKSLEKGVNLVMCHPTLSEYKKGGFTIK